MRAAFALLLLWLAPAAAGQVALPAGGGGGDLAEVSAALNSDALQPGQQTVLAVVVDVAEGHYLQSADERNEALFLIPLSVAPDVPAAARAYEPQYPPGVGQPYMDGQAFTNAGRVVTYVPIEVAADASPGPLVLAADVTFQICDEKTKVCFPPETRRVSVETRIVPAGEPVTATNADLFADFDPAVWAELSPYVAPKKVAAPGAESWYEWLLRRITSGGTWLALPAAFAAGIVFNVVPCVLPVLPLKIIGFFEAARHDRAKCVSLALAFAAGMVAVFTALGLLLFVTGQVANWGELFGYWWFALPITLLLIVAAVGTFGAFGASLPSGVYRFTPRHDTYVGNAQWGAFTAVLSTPCTFGLFAAALAWAASQPPWLGVVMLSVTGLGMAFPYVVLSFFPELARKMPASGGWGEAVKQATAFVILAVAAFFARPLLPAAVDGDGWWWVIFGLLAAGGVWLLVRGGALSHWRPVPVAVTAAVVAALLVPAGVVAASLANPPAGWVEFSQEAVADARAEGGPTVVKFTADWCLNCQTVEQRVFGSQAKLDAWRDRGVTLVKADLTDPYATGWATLAELNPSRSIPFTAVFPGGGAEAVELSGIYSAADLRAALGD